MAKRTAGGRNRYEVPPEKFILVWEEAESADEVSEKLEMPKDIVLARASGYRQKGVRLKNFKRGGKAIDVNGLNALIENIRARQKKGAK